MTSVRLAMVALLAMSCARSTRCDDATGACASSATRVVAVGEDVVLVPGQVAEVGPSRIRVAFDSITADSRCPSDVQCVWAGNATARMRVVVGGGTAVSVELNTMIDPKQASVNGHTLRLVALSPDPVSTSRIAKKDYRLTVRLDRTN